MKVVPVPIRTHITNIHWHETHGFCLVVRNEDPGGYISGILDHEGRRLSETSLTKLSSGIKSRGGKYSASDRFLISTSRWLLLNGDAVFGPSKWAEIRGTRNGIGPRQFLVMDRLGETRVMKSGIGNVTMVCLAPDDLTVMAAGYRFAVVFDLPQ